MPYFFDTYALIEYLQGNSNFLPFFEKGGMTTRLNLMELYYCLLRDHGQAKADNIYSELSVLLIEFPEELMKKAMKFRLKMRLKGRDISYTDAVGYIVALNRRVKFLTGDRQFKRLPNVIYLK